MTTMTSPASSRQRMPHKSIVWLLAAILIASAAIALRSLIDAMQPATPIQRATAIEPGSNEAIAQLQARVQRTPDDAAAYAQLGVAWLQRIRLTGDASLYGRVQEATEKALALDPQHTDALMARGALALALHDFNGALEWADRLITLNPHRAAAYGIRTDALVELGRYEEAVTALQKMVDLRPDMESYSRVSYLRELHGDVAGAVEAMQMAVTSAVPGTEPWLWTLTHVGHLYRSQHRLDEAEAAYRQVLAQRPSYAAAVAGLAQTAAARGRLDDAIEQLTPLTERLPQPETLILIGELYEVQGDTASAQAQYELVRVIQQINAAVGMAVDLELAAFETVHGASAVAALAQAKSAYTARPTIYAADTLAWAFYRSGRYQEAWAYSQAALRLGTQDALLHLHASLIAEALGDDAAARSHFEQVLAINPYPSPIAGKQIAEHSNRLEGDILP